MDNLIEKIEDEDIEEEEFDFREIAEEALGRYNNSMTEEIIDMIIDNSNNAETLEDVKEHLSDVTAYGCVSGCVDGMIDYSETSEFFEKHYDDIFELCNEIQAEQGLPLNIEFSANNLSWLAYEETCRKILNHIEFL